MNKCCRVASILGTGLEGWSWLSRSPWPSKREPQDREGPANICLRQNATLGLSCNTQAQHPHWAWVATHKHNIHIEHVLACYQHNNWQPAAKHHALAHAESSGDGWHLLVCGVWPTRLHLQYLAATKQEGGSCIVCFVVLACIYSSHMTHQAGFAASMPVVCTHIMPSLQPQIGFPTRIPSLIRIGRNHQNKRYQLVLSFPQWFSRFLELLGKRWLENLIVMVSQSALHGIC